MPQGLFVGLATLDLLYLAEQPLTQNQKQRAIDYTVAAGGPATNAAVAFCQGKNTAILLSRVGCHPIAELIRSDVQPWGVTIADLCPTQAAAPAISSIVVTQPTGERAVISINAARTQAESSSIPASLWQQLPEIDIVLIDGHQMAVGRTIALAAKALGIPVVVDGGSWKPEFETVLELADYVICSANFQPPNCQTDTETIALLARLGVPQIAITQGAAPIQYWTTSQTGQIEVPWVAAVDTLGAGDIFHGAFCQAILQTEFPAALAIAAQVAAHSCQFFGTRRWLEVPVMPAEN